MKTELKTAEQWDELDPQWSIYKWGRLAPWREFPISLFQFELLRKEYGCTLIQKKEGEKNASHVWHHRIARAVAGLGRRIGNRLVGNRPPLK